MILIIGGAYQGKLAYAARQYPGYQIVDAYEDVIRGQMARGEDTRAAAKALASRDRVCVILREVGCGPVPVDQAARAWREEVGRCGCLLAEGASAVIRVMCGIGVRIK